MEWNGMETRPKTMNHTLFFLCYAFSNIQASVVIRLCIVSARHPMTIYILDWKYSVLIFS